MSRDYGYTDDPEYVTGLNLGFKWKGRLDIRRLDTFRW